MVCTIKYSNIVCMCPCFSLYVSKPIASFFVLSFCNNEILCRNPTYAYCFNHDSEDRMYAEPVVKRNPLDDDEAVYDDVDDHTLVFQRRNMSNTNKNELLYDMGSNDTVVDPVVDTVVETEEEQEQSEEEVEEPAYDVGNVTYEEPAYDVEDNNRTDVHINLYDNVVVDSEYNVSQFENDMNLGFQFGEEEEEI
eukprot:m.196953 g.196953  ORF g.196953 m.196953 type:complete len:194 (+) comp13680_c0_seq13:1341-1922(+)